MRSTYRNCHFGRGSRIRTHTGGFGDRCATIDTIPLKELTILILTHSKKKFNTLIKNFLHLMKNRAIILEKFFLPIFYYKGGHNY